MKQTENKQTDGIKIENSHIRILGIGLEPACN